MNRSRMSAILGLGLVFLLAAFALATRAASDAPGPKIRVFSIEIVSVKARGEDGIGIDSSKLLSDDLLRKWGVFEGYRLHSIVPAAPAPTPGGTATMWVVFEKK